MTPMFLPYSPDLLPAIAEIYSAYASTVRGRYAFPVDRWEAVFTSPEVDPRRDVIVLSEPPGDPPGPPLAFCWLYMKPPPTYAYLRGPFLSPENPRLDEILDLVLGEAVRRCEEAGVGHVEGRSVHPQWRRMFIDGGFKLMGVYERWRLFPLKGNVPLFEPPAGGRIRRWEGIADLTPVIDIFREAFNDHWDYTPPRREDWEDVVKGKQFDPELALVALRGDSPVGYILGETMPDYTTLTVQGAYLISIGLKTAERGKGWGKALLGRWLRALYDAGSRSVELDVDAENRAAASLYTAFGFQRLRSEEVWRKYLR
jgi:ribosomal protein S18 acetylase RimI-like enzyme